MQRMRRRKRNFFRRVRQDPSLRVLRETDRFRILPAKRRSRRDKPLRRRWFTGATGLAVLIFMAVPCSGTPAEMETGAEEIVIDGGSNGPVFFPHRQHQDSELITCQACHGLFPQEADSINRLISDGALKSLQVMNSQCISCHRQTSAAGRPSGPRSCSTCHAK